MIKRNVPEVCNPTIPGCELELPLYDKKIVQKMLDFPGEYTVEDFREVLGQVAQRCTEAEAFVRAQYSYMKRLKAVWSRWLPLLSSKFTLSK